MSHLERMAFFLYQKSTQWIRNIFSFYYNQRIAKEPLSLHVSVLFQRRETEQI